MFDKGLILKIGGGPFDSNVIKEFKLLNEIKEDVKNKKYSTIIYGRNGSGKTTICNALDEISICQEERSLNVTLLDNEGNEYTNINSNIFVYSEKFIDKKIKFKSEGLETIVLLGDNLNIDEKINDLKVKQKNKEQELISYDLSVYDDKKNPLNPQCSWDKIISILKTEGNWATRKKQILSLSRNAAVNEGVINEIISNHSYKTTLEDFNMLLNDFLKIKENNYACEYKLNQLFVINSIDNIEKLLNTTLTKKDDDQLALEIYDVIDKYGNSRIDEISGTLESNIDYCPYCFQRLKKDYKEEVIKKIKNIISKEEDELRSVIDGSIIQKYYFEELPDFISDNEKLNLEKNVKAYNDEVSVINKYLIEKKDKLYTQMSISETKIIDSQIALQKSIDNITKIIDKHNNDVKRIKKIQEKLLDYNNALSWETIKNEYKIYQKNLDIKEKNKKATETITKELNEIEREIRNLEGKKKNISRAIEEINSALAYIFMCEERLQIKNDGNDRYVVLSRGKEVKASDLSTGERNIISLCYFFSCIGKGKSAKNRFKDEYTICIDDPISSVDCDNKIGIYSYLRQSISRIIKGNMKTRFILLTHNYEVAYNLDKILRDIYTEILKKTKNCISTLKLQEFNLSDENLNMGENQYKKLLDGIFYYADKDGGDITDLTIGNSIRRVLETFASFEFNDRMEFLNRKISAIDEENLDVSQLKNYMYRVLVNNESHGKIFAYAYDEIDKFETFTAEEKRNTAKLALVLLMKLNPEHLRAYLSEKISKIEEWNKECSKLMHLN